MNSLVFICRLKGHNAMCTNYSLISHHRSCEVDFAWTSKSKEDISASHLIQGLKWSKFKRGIIFPNIVSKIHDPKEKDVIEAAFRDFNRWHYRLWR